MRWAIELTAAATLQTALPAPVFNPPVDRPIILSIEQRREEPDAPPRTAIVERRIVFHRDGNGWRADVTHYAARSDRAGDAFTSAVATAAAAPIVFRLDTGGQITAIDNADDVWARLIAAMRTNVGEAAAAPLNALPPARRLAMLSSMLSGAIEAQAAGEGPLPPEPVTVPAAAIATTATPAMLPGTRHVLLEGGLLRIHVRASGPLPGVSGATGLVERDTRIDPATGLITQRVEKVENRLPGLDPAHARTTVTRIRYLDTRRETRR